MSTLHYLGAFLLAIAILVAIHELGHFLAARWCGVKVLRFSLGFGPQVFCRRFGKDATEFAIAAIPLGGFVRMLDEREAPVDSRELHRAFNVQSLGKRSLIVLAGPVANLLLAVILYWGMAWAGERDLPARVGVVPQGTAAAMAGLQAGDLIQRLGGDEILGWSDLRWQVIQRALGEETLPLHVQRGGAEVQLELNLQGVDIDEKAADPLKQLGLVLPPPKIAPVLASPLPGSPAEQAGLRAGDRILAVEGQAIAIWAEFVERVSASRGRELRLDVERAGTRFQLWVTPEEAPNQPGKGRIGVAVQPDEDYLANNTIQVSYGFLGGLRHGVEQTWSTCRFSLQVMWHIVTGRVSVRNVSGPVTIADYAGQSASAGIEAYLKFLAMVSISLGVLNLLPVPILDGGHLLYYAIEYIRGRPLSERLEALGQRLGMIFLALLMSLAFFNDLNRVFFG